MDRPPDEEELIERTKRGEADAYEGLVRAYQRIAFRTAYLITASAVDAEEAAQDGFVKAFRAIGRFRRGQPFRPWLLRIVANEARNRRRSSGRRARLSLRAAAERTSGDAVASPEESLVLGERSAALLHAVNGLPEAQRLVIACRYLLQLTDEETAAALGVRHGTVKSRGARALARLREELGGDDV